MKRSLLVASLFCATVISLAHAATLERFDDGRVVVSALGERLTFRKVDAASVGLTMRADAGCDSKTKGIGETTLARWLDDPKVAECLEREIQDKPKQGYYRAIRFHIKFTHENERVYDQDGGILYPGGIKQDELPERATLESEFFVNVRHPQIGRDCALPVEGGAGRLGFETLREEAQSPLIHYTLASGLRHGRTSKPLCLVCDPGGRYPSCNVLLWSKDKAVALILPWSERHFDGPQPSWLVYDEVARKVAQSIFADRPPGDLQ